MLNSTKTFESKEQARQFVERCEKDFERRLAETVKQVGENQGIRLIGLSGPTCSGKTTTANKLISHLTSMGKKVHMVSIDDFFLDRNDQEDYAQDSEIDYDSEDTIDFNALKKCIAEVFTDEPTQIPRYDFIKKKRTGYITIDPDENDLFIFEGIQAIYPRVTALFKEYNYKSIYICVESAINMEGVVFEPNELRLMRRLVRDYNFRGSSPDFTYYLWDSVRANEEVSIFPYASGCDYFINSTLPFEINLLAPYLRNILPLVSEGNEHKKDADALLKKIEGIEEVSPEYLIENSLCYEFIERKI